MPTLQQGLDRIFFEHGLLEGYHCENCNQNVANAAIKTTLLSAPKVLLIHVKRFTFTSDGNTTKNENPMTFPENLDLRRYIEGCGNDPANYELVSVIEHQGNPSDKNSNLHYIAIAKSRYEKKYYEFDDSIVTGLADQEVFQAKAYVLIYQHMVNYLNNKENTNSIKEPKYFLFF